MDPQQNQNIDGIKSNDTPNPTPASGVDGFVVPQKQPTQTFDQAKSQSSQQQDQVLDSQPTESPAKTNTPKAKSGRAVKVFLVIFIVLFAASSAAAAMFYMQNQQSQDDLMAAQAKSTQLQKQVDELSSSSSKDQVDKLTTENANLQKIINAQKAYIDSLTKVAQDLKTKCGTACSTTTIPPDTTTTAPTAP